MIIKKNSKGVMTAAEITRVIDELIIVLASHKRTIEEHDTYIQELEVQVHELEVMSDGEWGHV